MTTRKRLRITQRDRLVIDAVAAVMKLPPAERVRLALLLLGNASGAADDVLMVTWDNLGAATQGAIRRLLLAEPDATRFLTSIH
jgi:hypothetical protein